MPSQLRKDAGIELPRGIGVRTKKVLLRKKKGAGQPSNPENQSAKRVIGF